MLGRSVALVAVIASAVQSMPAFSAAPSLTDRGRRIIEENCSRCHAVGPTGTSRNAEAPPFRTVITRYPADNLAEALAEGIVTGHADMPQFVFAPDEIDAILAYLNSLSGNAD